MMIEDLMRVQPILILLATVIYVIYTGKLVKETTRLREIETSPFVGAHIDIHPGLSKIVVKNIGKAPAYNLEIEFEKEIFKEIRRADCSGMHQSKVLYFGVGQEMFFPFQTTELFDKSITLNLKYRSKENHVFEEKIILSLQSNKEMNTVYPKTLYHDDIDKIKNELKNIGEALNKLTKINIEDKLLSATDIDNLAKIQEAKQSNK